MTTQKGAAHDASSFRLYVAIPGDLRQRRRVRHRRPRQRGLARRSLRLLPADDPGWKWLEIGRRSPDTPVHEPIPFRDADAPRPLRRRPPRPRSSASACAPPSRSRSCSSTWSRRASSSRSRRRASRARATTLKSAVLKERVGSVRSQAATRYDASPAEIVAAASLPHPKESAPPRRRGRDRARRSPRPRAARISRSTR